MFLSSIVLVFWLKCPVVVSVNFDQVYLFLYMNRSINFNDLSASKSRAALNRDPLFHEILADLNPVIEDLQKRAENDQLSVPYHPAWSILVFKLDCYIDNPKYIDHHEWLQEARTKVISTHELLIADFNEAFFNAQ